MIRVFKMYLMNRILFLMLLLYGNGSLAHKGMIRNISDFVNVTTVSTTTEADEYSEEYFPGQKAVKKCENYKSALCLPKLSSQSEEIMFYKDILNRRLVHGGLKAEPKRYPYMAAIGYCNNKNEILWLCGGSLISENFILTAAHCCSSPEWGYAVWARLGDVDLLNNTDDEFSKNYRIIERIKHPNYTARSYYHDIALLKLEKNVDFNFYVKPACLSFPNESDPQLATVTGWGRINWDDEKGSDHLLEAYLKIVNNTRCNYFYEDDANKLKNGIVSDWQICAGADGKDTCQGDSGGPLAISDGEDCTYNILGITSIGKICGGLAPGVYTRVSYYIPWIESIVWP